MVIAERGEGWLLGGFRCGVWRNTKKAEQPARVTRLGVGGLGWLVLSEDVLAGCGELSSELGEASAALCSVEDGICCAACSVSV